MGNQDELNRLGVAGGEAAEAVEELGEMFEAAKVEVDRLALERRECQELLLGEQWIETRVRDNALISLRDLRSQDDMQYLQDNALADSLEARVAQVCGAIPNFEATPATNEQADFTKAKATTAMIRPLLYHLNSLSHWQMMHVTAGMYDCGFGKVGWSPSLGPVKRGKPMGDVALSVIPPFDIFADPDADRVAPQRTDENDARWLFHRYTTTVGELELLMNGEHDEKTPTGLDQVWAKLPEKIEPFDHEASPDSRRNRERTARWLKNGKLAPWCRIELLAFYAFPDSRNEAGRYCLLLPKNDNWILNYRKSLPYDAKKDGKELPGLFPFYMVWDKRWPGQLAGRSRTKAAAVHQRTINRRLSEREDLLAKVTPKTFVDKRMGIDFNGLRSVPGMGVVVPFDGMVGDKLPVTDWPTAVDRYVVSSIDAETRAKRGIEDRMGIHSLANYPRRPLTATEAVEAMRYDQDALSQDAKQAERGAYTHHVSLVLQMVLRKCDEDRLVSFVGDRNRSEVVRIAAGDIHYKDIIIVSEGTSMPRNRRLMKAEVLEAAKVGAYSSPTPEIAEKKMRLFMEHMELKSSMEMTGDDMDVQNAKTENADLVAGKTIKPPQPGDNDWIHLYGPGCHVELYKTPEFRNLEPGKKAAAMQELQAHMGLHQMNIDQATEELAARNPNLPNPQAELMKIALGRVRPGTTGDGGRGTGSAAGPAAMQPAPGQPVDFQRPDGTRVYRETAGPKSSNQVQGK